MHGTLLRNYSEDEVAQSVVLTSRMFLYDVGTVFYTRTQAINPVPVEVALVVELCRWDISKDARNY